MNIDKILSEIIFETPERIKEPYSWVKHIPFAFFLIERFRPEVFVELGVHTGNSFCAFCQAVKKLGLKTKCYGVDTWKGDKLSGLYGEEIYKDLYQHLDNKYKGNFHLLKTTFNEASKLFVDRDIDLLHIDGLHTYEEVKKDFESWIPKMSKKGIVILHDTIFKEGDFGVWKFWEEISKDYDSINFEYGYGLGLLVVGEEVDKRLTALLGEIDRNIIYKTIFQKLGEGIFFQALIKKQPFTKIYIDIGMGYSEEMTLFMANSVNAGYINLKWDLTNFSKTGLSRSDISKIKGIRWDPVEKWCKVKLNNVTFHDDTDTEYSIDIDSITHNGKPDENGWVVFETSDPMFFLPLNIKPVHININGKLEFICDAEIDNKFTEKELKILDQKATIQMLESELNMIKGSRLWKLTSFFQKIIPDLKIIKSD